jgi:hypothetical protein
MSGLHIFLSYCRENKPEVRELHDVLVRRGFKVWWDEDLLAGQNWKSELRKAIKSSGAVVACFSAEVQKRDATGMFPELRDAIEVYRQMRPESIFLIPIRLSECRIPELPIDATSSLLDLHYVDLFPKKRYTDGVKELVNALSMCPLLKRLPTVDNPGDREEHLIAQQAFRVGQSTDPIDDVTSVIVFKGSSDKMKAAIELLKQSYNDLVSETFDHGKGVHEVIVHSPVGSAQISILAKRCGIKVQSIDHLPEPFYSDFTRQLQRYMKSDRFIDRVIDETTNISKRR